MNIVNKEIITKILSDSENNDEIIVLKWDVNNNIIKAGNNYMSEVSRLTIDYEKDGKQFHKTLFLKAPFNSPMYQTGVKFNLFNKELLMYTEVFPLIYNIESEYFTPRHYFADDKHSLYLKDLSQSGYRVANRLEQLDFEHCNHALKCLARLHGLSVKLNKEFGIPDPVKKDPFYSKENNDKNLTDGFLSGLNIFLENLSPEIREKYTKTIEKCRKITWDKLSDEVMPKNNPFNVLNHGDYWTNNIMFKYDKYNIIKKAKMLDFQLSRWTSPAVDLIYFTITSMQFEVFEKYFDLLIQIYLDTLNKILNKLNCEPYGMNQLKTDINKLSQYLITIITCILPIIVSNPDDPIDLQEVMKNEQFNPNSMKKTFNQKRYLEIAEKWFIYFAEKDLGDSNK